MCIPLYFLSFFIVFYVTLQSNLRRHLHNEKVHDLKALQDINYGDQIKKNEVGELCREWGDEK
jgi:hypothetical protein